MKVYSIEINSLVAGMMCGSPIQQGSLGFVVDRMPTELYEKVEIPNSRNYVILSRTDGVYKAFEVKPGTSGGFANRPLTFWMKGGNVFKSKGRTRVTYTGDIWDTGTAYHIAEQVAGCELIDISLKTRLDRVYIGGYLFSKDVVEEKIGHLIKLAPATQNKQIEFN